MWNIEKIVSKGDYNYAIVREHPNRTKNGYVLEHRVIIENRLGRLLNADEVVHHINGNKKDNRPENLEVMSASEHCRLHAMSQGASFSEMKCPNCQTLFVVPRAQTFYMRGRIFTACSNRCRGQFSRQMQLYGRTAEMELAISENLVREFHSLDNPEQTVKQQDA